MYIVCWIAKAGTQVIVPYRDQEEQRHLRVTGDLGQVVPMVLTSQIFDRVEQCLNTG